MFGVADPVPSSTQNVSYQILERVPVHDGLMVAKWQTQQSGIQDGRTSLLELFTRVVVEIRI